ncbi:cyclase family protein [uncultured Clostridium sp.]|uniref:cyclase family protein n=1 Tax=Clostridium sp. TaxID=1506 RepID=UPI0025E9EEF9|nr:cyclase family protein [uncultured Clostridium sp.]
MKYIDLSYDIKNEMPVYPGDMELNLSKEKDYDKDEFNLYTVSTSMHVGTHIDAPLHMCKNKKFISEYSIDKFIGNAVLLDVRGEKVIEIKDEYYRDIKENDIVLLFTGWDSFYGKEEYYNNHPIVSEELAELLIKKKIKMLGMDMPSPDNHEYNIHKKLFENEIFILENLTNLNKLLYNEEIQVFAQPLKIQGEASLVRAIAVYKGY